MSRTRTRTVTAGLAAALLLITAVPASAATETYAAEASSAGLTLSLAGNDVLDVGSTFASAVPGEALATAVPAAIGGTPIGEREAASDGPLVLDPADPADRCLAAVPAPLDALVGAGLACADAAAEGAVPAAAATAGVAEVSLLDLDGEALAPLHDLLATLPLNDLLATVEDQLLGQLGDAFGDVRAECIAALDPLNVGGLLDPLLEPLVDASPAEIAALIEGLQDLLGELVPTVCSVLGDLADLLVDGDLLGTITEGDLLGALAGEEGLLTVTLLETESVVARDGDAVHAAAGPADGGAIAITLDIPLLDEVLGDLLEDVVAPVLSELSALLAPLGDAVAPLPVVGDLLGPLLAGGDLGDLLEGPLLSVGVAPGGASATGDLVSEETTGEASPALVELGGTLFALPVLSGLEAALNEVAGVLDDTLLAALRDSPLDDLVSVELLPESVTDAEVGGLPGTQATSGTASVAVLGVLGDTVGGALVDLEVAPALAGVGLGEDTDGGTPPTTPPTPVTPAGPDATPPTRGNLPVTGGSAALLGLAALGAAASLRRRR